MSRSEYNDEAAKAWFAFAAQFPDADPRTAFNRGFFLGGQYTMRVSSSLSPHIARFIEFMMWLTERSDEEV